MKLKEVIEICLTFLGDEDPTISSSTKTTAKIKLLVRCANIVIKEIASDYLPLTATKTCNVQDGVVEYSLLDYRVKEVLSVKSNDVETQWKAMPSKLKVDCDGKVDITYSYLPADVDLDDECDVDVRVSPVCLAMGTCTEYCMIDGNYELAVMMNDKFMDSIAVACRSNREKKIKGRVWR
ncbi:MAG: hypothetical protein ACI4M5_04785 [Christensenellales bacterium]